MSRVAQPGKYPQSDPGKHPCNTCHGFSRQESFSRTGESWFPSHYISANLATFIDSARTCSLCACVVEGFWHFATKLGYTRGEEHVDFCRLSADIRLPTEGRGVSTVVYSPKSWAVPSDESKFPSTPLSQLRLTWFGNDLEFRLEHKYEALPWSALGVVKPNATMETCAATISGWLERCIEQHGPKCSILGTARSPPWVPTRLISLGRDNDDMRLVIPANSLKAAYTALSYCWGEPPSSLTTVDNLSTRLKRLHWSDLPRCHQDAVTLTRKLGVTHIWIDSFCILQEDAADWEIESALMAEVYSNALLVISAAYAGDVSLPLISQQKTITLPNPLCEDPTTEPAYIIANSPINHKPMAYDASNRQHDWPMFTRAWTFQERFLSSRVVHFTPDEMIWECRAGQICECGYMDSNPMMSNRCLVDRLFAYRGDTTPVQRGACAVWMMTLLVASDRALSRDQDRLVALSGLAKRFSSLNLGRYLAGMWEHELVPFLCWYPQEHGFLRRPRRYKKEPSAFVAPTWSWASVVGPIWYDANLLLDPLFSRFHATVHDVQCKLVGAEIFGAVSSGTIELTAPTIDVVYHEDEPNPVPMDDMCVHSRFIFDVEIARPGTLEGWGPAEVIEGDILKCVFIWTLNPPSEFGTRAATALVLKNDVSGLPGWFQRVGILDLRPYEHEMRESRKMDAIVEWVGSLLEQSITIV